MDKSPDSLPLEYCKINVELECGSKLMGCWSSSSETIDGYIYKYVYWGDLEIGRSRIKYWEFADEVH
jgi:hypothetical protein